MIVDKSKWVETAFAKIATSQLGKTLDANKNKGVPYPYLCAANVGMGYFNLSNVKEILLEDSELEKYIVRKGDLLICEGGDTGRCAIWESEEPIYYQNALHRVRFNDNVHNKFIMYYLHYYKKVGIIDKLSHGQTIKHFTQKGLSKLSFRMPTISSQKGIAAELDALQAMIDGYKAQLHDLDELIKSIFNNTFGDIHSNPYNFDIKLMQDVCSKITDGTHNPPKFVDSGIPFIFVSNIANYEISYLAKKHIDDASYNELWKSTPVEVGDVVYTSVGSYGNPAIVRTDKKFMFQRHIALLKPKHDVIESEYLKWFLISPSGKEQADNKAIGAAQKTLNLKAIKSFKIIVPPKEKQRSFTAQVEILEKQKTLLQEQLADAEQLMAERMQYYFS